MSLQNCAAIMTSVAITLSLFNIIPVIRCFGLHSVLPSFRPTPSSSFTEIRLSSRDLEPQAVSTGYSQSPDFITALTEATTTALSSLPPINEKGIDLGFVYISSLYDGQFSPSGVVPCILDVCNQYFDLVEGEEVLKHLIGCYSGGLIGSSPILNSFRNTQGDTGKACRPFESEGTHGVTVTLCVLPDTNIQTFHVLGEDVPDDIGRISPDMWKNAVGLRGFENDATTDSKDNVSTTFMLLPSPSFQNEMDDFLRGITRSFGPSTNTFGGIASTVSSLSRARLFRFDVKDPYCMQTLGDGCVGVVLSGDVQVKVMVAQGVKPVGGIYRVVNGQDSTISSIQLDEMATAQLNEENEEEEEEEEEELAESEMNAEKRAAAAYAKAAIPKPVLAEANFLMKTLSDDDQAFMRKSILVGLERSGGMAKTPNELLRLAQGYGHCFTVHRVASAGMKDGSVTLPLGCVDVERGTRFRFFVRDGKYAKREIEAIWMGYKKKELERSFNNESSFTPSGCFLFPTLDRGTKMFGGKPGFESSSISEFLPALPSIGGFFTNGVIAKLDDDSQVMIHGSASCYALIGPRSNRRIYSALEDAAQKEEKEEAKKMNQESIPIEDDKCTSRARDVIENVNEQPAPRSKNGELLIKRREIHSGRALTVSNVEWSVVDNIAIPTSALEGFVWGKEAEVDRFRERVPLANLVSQCKLANLDAKMPQPRSWIDSIKRAAQESNFVIIPEIKRLEPSSGSLRRRYDLSKLTKQLTLAGAPAFSVNCDGVLFGGSMDDVTTAREVSSTFILETESADEGVVAPPVLASDLILYPYQLYKLRLASADAFNLIVGALETKDLLYLTKIAGTLQMQTIASVTSEVQISAITKLSPGSISALVVSNRKLETFDFDDSGEQALALLKSNALNEFSRVHTDTPVLVEGRVGIVEREGSPEKYLIALKEAGAFGAIVGGALAIKGDVVEAYKALSSSC